MKNLILCAIVLLAIGACSCQKDCPAVPTIPPDPLRISGNWIGKYSGNDATPPTTNQYWILKDNGDMFVYDGQTGPTTLSAKGTWNLIDGVFKCSYNGVTNTYNRSIKLDLNEDEDEMSGFRGEDGSYTGNGQCEMSKE